MNKKDLVRKYLLTRADETIFTADNLAAWVNTINKRDDITRKDVSNVITPLIKNGAITAEKPKDGKHFVYTVIKNNISLWFAKHPIGARTKPAIKLPDLAKIIAKPTNGKRAKNRSPFIMSIDAEIAELNGKIKRLHAIRKEFA